jgi:hypothetical protein
MGRQTEYADLIAQSLRGPQGPADIALHTGTIVTWDDVNGLNSVLVNDVILNNLKVVRQGIGQTYSPGEVVMIQRKQTQYYITGKVETPGVSSSNLIVPAYVSTLQGTTSTSFTDLATVGPTATVRIGASRKALVFANCGVEVEIGAHDQNTYTGGWFTLAVTGASNIVPSGLSTQFWAGGQSVYEGDFISTLSQTWVVTAAHGLNAGINNFTMKYASVHSTYFASFSGRFLVVIPL